MQEEYEILNNQNSQNSQQTQIDDLHIILVLDESGSMEEIRMDIIGSVNTFITDQQELKKDNSKMTFIKFNGKISVVYERVPLGDVNKITTSDYKPNDMTALYDAIGFALTKYSDDKNVCVIIVTDGQENSSKEFKRQKVAELIEKRKENNWNFVYLSADFSQMQQAEAVGIQTTQMGFRTNTQNMVTNYENLSTEIHTRCSSIIKEIRTSGGMKGRGI